MSASELSINRNNRSAARNDAMNSLWHTFFIHLHIQGYLTMVIFKPIYDLTVDVGK